MTVVQHCPQKSNFWSLFRCCIIDPYLSELFVVKNEISSQSVNEHNDNLANSTRMPGMRPEIFFQNKLMWVSLLQKSTKGVK